MREAGGDRPEPGARSLPDDALLVFLSDTHIGGDSGLDYFESPEDLTALFEGLAAHDGPVELVLAGDFFDLLMVGEAPSGENRASVTISRPEYERMFSALRKVADGRRRVVYLPGNHDAEAWWNPEVRKTLREEGLVDEFALSYTARFESVPERLIYCEHGNQLDPTNAITDYDNPLDTPFGDHIVTDVVRRVVPAGRIGRDLDLREIGMIFPLLKIPEWAVSRVFYDLLSRAATYMLLPLLLIYALYRIIAYIVAISPPGSQNVSFWESYAALPGGQVVFGEIAWNALLLAAVFVLFFLAVRRSASRTISSLYSGGSTAASGASDEAIKALLESDEDPPQRSGLRAREIDVFVSGHTHAPSLCKLPREGGEEAVIVNSGCWLRQLRPIPARLGQPPVYVPEFVQTHARVYLQSTDLVVELWENPKSAPRRLRNAERLAILGRLPDHPAPDAEPRILLSERLSNFR